MPVSVICGGQFGSEGKGKTTYFFAKHLNAKVVIRVGGPNSGHTIIAPDGGVVVLKQLPVSAYIPEVYSVISPGSYLNLDILHEEIRQSGIQDEFLIIDPYAVVISSEDVENDVESGLGNAIGSTGSGLGSSVSRRVNRDIGLGFAKDEPSLEKYLRPTSRFLRSVLDENERILIEGTQGFGLSMLHAGRTFPFVTSRDTSAAAFVAEAGLSPIDVDDVIMVLRAFPIRVAGNSGPLPLEVNWDEVTRRSGSEVPLVELTSVTRKLRRVAEFHPEVVLRAIEVNKPTRIVLNHVDYFDVQLHSGRITPRALDAIRSIEDAIDRPVDFIGCDRVSLYERCTGLDRSAGATPSVEALHVH